MVLDSDPKSTPPKPEVSDKDRSARRRAPRRGGRIRLSLRKSACPKIEDIMGDFSEQTGSVFS